jgi:diguanylate cyclase (GGDEF)-like protein
MTASFMTAFQPRDARAAATTVAAFSWVAAVTNIVFTMVQPDGADALALAVAAIVSLAIAGAGWWIRSAARVPMTLWTLVPFLAIAAIVVLDLLTRDASTAAQIYLFFPVLYAASQLPRRGAVVVTAVTVVGEAAVVLTGMPFRSAVLSIGYVASAMVVIAALLVLAGERQDRLVSRLRTLAAVDQLTGLSTRSVLDRAAQSALSGAASGDGTALVLLDIDNFKSINDTYGHPAGDAVLVQLATVLMGGTRPTDVISRLGGDEIALLMPGCSLQTSSQRVQDLLATIRRRRFELDDGTAVQVSISAGIAHSPTHALDLRRLYATADAALYDAKRDGKDRVAVSS